MLAARKELPPTPGEFLRTPTPFICPQAVVLPHPEVWLPQFPPLSALPISARMSDAAQGHRSNTHGWRLERTRTTGSCHSYRRDDLQHLLTVGSQEYLE